MLKFLSSGRNWGPATLASVESLITRGDMSMEKTRLLGGEGAMVYEGV